ncbi:MAG: aminomethyl-transferring glycine dehydrogenase subunit GcvPA [Candidatus Heimdallarchaeota archaeon]|nr:MAG: aminomethyl-transferring glycine dehydrogenase subunit GcvPA [Candidatus Heimdallarchaeota archaeon]
MTSYQRFIHPYLPQTETQIETMLESIGVSTIGELFSEIPEKLRLKEKLNLPLSHSEQETLLNVKKILGKNKTVDEISSFLGAGIYQHFIPTVVSTLLSRSEFYTSYTPYAPEISQGMLQALWEYQSMIAEITRLDLVNSSMYDMATALGEAALMCTRVTRKEVFLVPSYLQPERFQTLLTYTQGPGISVKTYPFDKETGKADLYALAELAKSHKNQLSGIYLENPNFWGVIEEDVQEVEKITHNMEGIFVVGIDPISLGILTSPGEYGADIAIGEGQSIGLPMNFGGPLLGIFAVKNDRRLSRAMPGRIIGISTEVKSSKRAFTMTLQTREQHIRREKATSNICTNNALCALASTIFLSLLGPIGLKRLAEICMARTTHLLEELRSIEGIKSPYFSGVPFKEFIFQLDSKFSSKELDFFLQSNNIQGGLSLQKYFPELRQCYLSAVTEMAKITDIDQFTQKIREFILKHGG